MDNYLTGKDVYVTLISTAKGVPYETLTKEAYAKQLDEWISGGKKGPAPINYRNQGKTLQLALSYGLGVDALSEQLGIPLQEAKNLMEDFKVRLSGVFAYEDKLKEFARKHGYVNTIWGTKRRFPNYALPEISVRSKNGTPISRHTYNTIINAFNGVWQFNERRALVAQLELAHDVKVYDNKELRSEDETKILNSVIQGSGAYMVKMALVKIASDDIMNKIGAVPILAIHDEIVIEVKREHSEMAKQRLEEIMLEAAYMVVKKLPFIAEGEISEKWEVED